MDGAILAMWMLGLGACAAFVFSLWYISRRVKQARNWPQAEATIESAQMGRMGQGKKAVDLPCFAFSYVVKGRSYAGHFALRASGDRAESLMRQMVQKKMAIHYDPQWPAGWYIPVGTIGGCEVLQKLYNVGKTEQAGD